MTVKLCKDCRHCAKPLDEQERVMEPWVWECSHPASTTVDLVDGTQKHLFCQSMRAGPRCDTEGKLWETW